LTAIATKLLHVQITASIQVMVRAVILMGYQAYSSALPPNVVNVYVKAGSAETIATALHQHALTIVHILLESVFVANVSALKTDLDHHACVIARYNVYVMHQSQICTVVLLTSMVSPLDVVKRHVLIVYAPHLRMDHTVTVVLRRASRTALVTVTARVAHAYVIVITPRLIVRVPRYLIVARLAIVTVMVIAHAPHVHVILHSQDLHVSYVWGMKHTYAQIKTLADWLHLAKSAMI
jgi:hypothetical protein